MIECTYGIHLALMKTLTNISKIMAQCIILIKVMFVAKMRLCILQDSGL